MSSWRCAPKSGFKLSVVLVCATSALGCSVTAPIKTWQTSALSSQPGNSDKRVQKVAFASITGPEEVALRLENALEQTQPPGSMHIAMVSSAATPAADSPSSKVQLASHSKAVSMLTTMETLKSSGTDLMIQGHISVIDFELSQPEAEASPNSPGAAMAVLQQMSRPTSESAPEQIVVSWEAYDVQSGAVVNSTTVSLNRVQAEELYPELAMVADPIDRLLMGVSRQTWSQFVPSLDESKVKLQVPYFSRGATDTRKGNASAANGLWQSAEYEWQGVVALHPHNKAAWHNLAMAAVAKEDFELARARISRAKSWLPSSKVKETELWIDERQKAYHRAFGLPDREEGWLNPDPVKAPVLSDAAPVQPVDIDKLPWWTAIPGTKPPGWTWKAWLTQPFP